MTFCWPRKNDTVAMNNAKHMRHHVSCNAALPAMPPRRIAFMCGAAATGSDHAEEFWIIPAGKAQLSLGFLSNEKALTISVSLAVQKQLVAGTTLAVTLEPKRDGMHTDSGHMKGPENTLSMMAGKGPYGRLEMGGAFTVVRVRDEVTPDYRDPCWYRPPQGTVAWPV